MKYDIALTSLNDLPAAIWISNRNAWNSASGSETEVAADSKIMDLILARPITLPLYAGPAPVTVPPILPTVVFVDAFVVGTVGTEAPAKEILLPGASIKKTSQLLLKSNVPTISFILT